MKPLTIGQLAEQAGVHTETVRYYERRGLLAQPPRRAAGYRQYSPDYVARINFIKRAQQLGFSLKEIGELLALRVESTAVCSEVQQKAVSKIEDIKAKIQLLQQMKKTLTDLVSACEANQITSACPMLDALTNDGGEM